MELLARQAIINAFVELLNECPINRISVISITKRAHISRNTFYYWYNDIYALIDDLFLRETQKIIEDNQSITSWQEGFLHATRFAYDNRIAIFNIYNSACRDRLNKYLYDVTFSDISDAVKHDADGLHVEQDDMNAITHFYTSALIGMCNKWLENGMKEDPDEYISHLGKMFAGNIRISLERVSKP